MKATIENSVLFANSDSLTLSILSEFNMILQAITQAKDETELRTDMQNLKPKYFNFGFGSIHMWVHQLPIKQEDIINENLFDKRIIFVEIPETAAKQTELEEYYNRK